MKHSLAAAAALAGILTIQPAFADTPAAAHSATAWQGLFGGANLGFGATDTTINQPGGGPTPFPIATDPDGALPGIQFGYNHQSGRVLFGLVADMALNSLSGAANGRAFAPPTAFRTEYDRMATARGRIGFLAGETTLIYGHGGLAFAEISHTEVGGAGPFAGVSSSDEEFGYVIGAGLEVMTGDNISLFAEYSFTEFDTPSPIPTAFGPLFPDTEPLHVVKFGVNYHF
ncbi:MAG: outer membrane beta-barrel protein [Roseovarius sp.]